MRGQFSPSTCSSGRRRISERGVSLSAEAGEHRPGGRGPDRDVRAGGRVLPRSLLSADRVRSDGALRDRHGSDRRIRSAGASAPVHTVSGGGIRRGRFHMARIRQIRGERRAGASSTAEAAVVIGVALAKLMAVIFIGFYLQSFCTFLRRPARSA